MPGDIQLAIEVLAAMKIVLEETDSCIFMDGFCKVMR